MPHTIVNNFVNQISSNEVVLVRDGAFRRSEKRNAGSTQNALAACPRAMYSHARAVSAMIVSVGPTAPFET